MADLLGWSGCVTCQRDFEGWCEHDEAEWSRVQVGEIVVESLAFHDRVVDHGQDASAGEAVGQQAHVPGSEPILTSSFDSGMLLGMR